MTEELLVLTSDIVSAHVSHNAVGTAELPALIRVTFEALQKLGESAAPAAPAQEPAVSIRTSVKPDYLVCLEDGKKLTMLKRYLRTNYDMSPDDYRAKWRLPREYPMVAPNYAEKRRALAHSIGLGRKPAKSVDGASTVDAVEAVAEPIENVKAAVTHLRGSGSAPAPKRRALAKPRAPKVR